MDLEELNNLFNVIKEKYNKLLIKINDINKLKKNNILINKLKKKVLLNLTEFNEELDKSLFTIDKISNNLNLIELDNEINEEIRNYYLNEKVYKKFLIPMLIYKQNLLNN